MPTIKEIKASKFYYKQLDTHQKAFEFIVEQKLPPFSIFLKPTRDDSFIEVVYIDLPVDGFGEKDKFNSEVILVEDNEYDFALTTETNARVKRKIYIEYTVQGLVYEVLNVREKVKRATIPWDKLPQDFPDSFSDIDKRKNQFLPILLDRIANNNHVHRVFRIHFEFIPTYGQERKLDKEVLIPCLDVNQSMLQFQHSIEDLILLSKDRAFLDWYSGSHSPQAISPNTELKGEGKVDNTVKKEIKNTMPKYTLKQSSFFDEKEKGSRKKLKGFVSDSVSKLTLE